MRKEGKKKDVSQVKITRENTITILKRLSDNSTVPRSDSRKDDWNLDVNKYK